MRREIERENFRVWIRFRFYVYVLVGFIEIIIKFVCMCVYFFKERFIVFMRFIIGFMI